MLNKNIKYALSLEGGGVRGAYQAGAIMALHDNGYEFSAACGTSIGSINAAFVAMKKFDELKDLWLNVQLKDIFQFANKEIEKSLQLDFKNIDFFELIKGIINTTAEGGLNISPMFKFLEKHIDEKLIRNSDIDYGLVTYNLSDMKPEERMISDMPEGSLIDFIVASSYLPAFKQQKLQGKHYIDGGFYNNLPTNMLVDRDYKDVIEIKLHLITKRIEVKEKFNRNTINVSEHLGPILIYKKERILHNYEIGYQAGLNLIKGENNALN